MLHKVSERLTDRPLGATPGGCTPRNSDPPNCTSIGETDVQNQRLTIPDSRQSSVQQQDSSISGEIFLFSGLNHPITATFQKRCAKSALTALLKSSAIERSDPTISVIAVLVPFEFELNTQFNRAVRRPLPFGFDFEGWTGWRIQCHRLVARFQSDSVPTIFQRYNAIFSLVRSLSYLNRISSAYNRRFTACTDKCVLCISPTDLE